MSITAYVDGACHGNPGPGGWGVVLSFGEHVKELYGYEPDTTNNRMELTAAIQALAALKRDQSLIRIYTDSQYVQKGMTEWIHGWRRKGRLMPGPRQVLNLDLWLELDSLASRHRVEFAWVKGHAGIPGNERADQLASKAIKQRKRTASGVVLP